MQRILITAAFFLGALSAAPAAEAREVYSGTDLIINCKDPVICDVFLLALLDTQLSLSGWYRLEATYCPPVNLGMILTWGVVRAYFDRNEDLLGDSAGSLAISALEEAMPCSGTVKPEAALMPRFFTGIDLIVACANPLVCEAFLIGVMDAHQTHSDWGRIQPLVCLGEEIENTELMAATLAYLETHEDQLGFTAGSLVLLALAETYAC